MSQRQTFIRSLHDIGLAAWFGGSLMGAVGLNGAAAEAKDPRERLRLSSLGWAKWSPVQFGALVVHAIGGAGLIIGNKGRLAVQGEGRANTVVKLAITLTAAGISLYSALVGKKMDDHADEGTQGTTEPFPGVSKELDSAQRQQKLLQWLIPGLTGILIIMAAQQGEQQRPVGGFFDRFRG
ncbi:MAG: putative integral rane protein [Microbacteriaceae bacterium]|jgi:hypothetical protein|nr:putative integral rane protein [Microbacteriaceae bacterium]HEV7956345.1 hypothetical protein [Marisediminicola sp.]